MRIIVGAGNTMQEGWHALQHSDLDIRVREQWQRLFAPASLEAVLSEHVIEHLTEHEAEAAARNVYEFLRRGGHWRIAVPDGFHPDKNYYDWVAPGSEGERYLQRFRGNEPGHKTLWNHQTLTRMLIDHGFTVMPREWFDQAGRFHKTRWLAAHGQVWRCAESCWSKFLSLWVGAPYTSLIVDAFKE